MLKIVMFTVIGAALGGVFGYYGKCTSGTCPLTATPWRGGLYGAFMGLMIGLSSPRSVVTAGPEHGEAFETLPHIESPEEFHAQVINAGGPVLVDFYADWCGPCRALAPRLADLTAQYGDQIKVVKVNVDTATDLARQYSVSSIPDLRLFSGGQQIDQMVGLPSAAELADFARIITIPSEE